jgi:PEP-CTERM motif-containing protein
LATALNSTGQIVGSSDDGGIPKAAYWSTAGAQPQALPSGGGPDANVYATSINDQPTIVGYFTGSGSGNAKSWTAVKWQPDPNDLTRFRFTKLDTPVVPPAGAPAGAFGVNQMGTVVGSGAIDPVMPIQGPLRWSPNDQVTPLDTVVSDTLVVDYNPVAVNDSLVAAGRLVTNTGDERAVRWNADGSALELGFPAGYNQSAALDINNQGLIVGRAFTASDSIAVSNFNSLWTNLNDLIVNAPNWHLDSASAINDSGIIIGQGKLAGAPRAFLLTPINPTLFGDYNQNGVVDAADYTVWRESLGRTGAGLAADGTGATDVPDGVVDQLDYNFWKANFGNHSGSGGASSSHVAVPEPATLWMLLAGILTVCCCRRP